ncbi:hypothetical protein ACJJTC_004264 [Scirpophaga incertulas]
MNLCSLILLALGLCATSSLASCTNEKVVYCFWGTWATYRQGDGQFNVEDLNTELCTHISYTFFGIDVNGFMKSLDPWLDLPDGRDYLRKFSAIKERNPDIKRIFAVGGFNEGSEKYSVMAANKTLRTNFINSTLQMVLDYDVDGMELDWEFPNARDTVHGEEDIDNFTQLLKELREAFDEYGLSLTAAVSAVEASASQYYDVKGISQYLDYINVMTYDLHGPWDNVTGYNAALHKGEGDEDEPKESLFTVDVAIDYWINSGAPPSKLLLGVPFYGHSFKLEDASKHGLKSNTTGPGISGPYTLTPGHVGYNEFCVMLQTEDWNVEHDHKARVPYAYKDLDWVSFDDPHSIRLKAEYARKRNLAGVMLWSIETDDFRAKCGSEDFPMLRAINRGLGREVPPPTATTTVIGTSPPTTTVEN